MRVLVIRKDLVQLQNKRIIYGKVYVAIRMYLIRCQTQPNGCQFKIKFGYKSWFQILSVLSRRRYLSHRCILAKTLSSFYLFPYLFPRAPFKMNFFQRGMCQKDIIQWTCTFCSSKINKPFWRYNSIYCNLTRHI